MVDELRRDICLGDPTEALLLHETRLAERFGVSRTPVRQALQRLAYERLVETRSGIGTTVVPLDPERRGAHVALLRGLLHLAARLGVRAGGADTTTALVLQGLGPKTGPAAGDTLAAVFNQRAAILRLAGSLIADPILQESHAAAHWRVLRWRMAAARADSAGALHTVLALGRAVAAAPDPARMLALIAEETAPAAHPAQRPRAD